MKNSTFWDLAFFSEPGEFYGSVGIKMLHFSVNKKLRYFFNMSWFLEYTTKNEIIMGISVDPVVSILELMKLVSELKKEGKFDTWDDRPEPSPWDKWPE